jgi:hypothetical protein
MNNLDLRITNGQFMDVECFIRAAIRLYEANRDDCEKLMLTDTGNADPTIASIRDTWLRSIDRANTLLIDLHEQRIKSLQKVRRDAA